MVDDKGRATAQVERETAFEVQGRWWCLWAHDPRDDAAYLMGVHALLDDALRHAGEIEGDNYIAGIEDVLTAVDGWLFSDGSF